MKEKTLLLTKYNSKLIPSCEGIFFPKEWPIHGEEIAPSHKACELTDGTSIWYEDEAHIYFRYYPDSGIKVPYFSVTTLLHLYQKEFNQEKMSTACALKVDYDCSCLDKTDWDLLNLNDKKRRIENAWEQNRINSAFYGTYIHSMLEGLVVYKEAVKDIYEKIVAKYSWKYPIALNFASSMQEYISRKLDPDDTLIAEPLIFDPALFIAGQSDLVAVNHVKKYIKILDYKTNKKKPGTDKVYGKLNFSLSHLEDSNLTMYSIQLCFYQKLVSIFYPGYGFETNYILWLNRETGQIEEIPVYPEEWENEIENLYAILLEVAADIIKNKTRITL
jgi:hypothetical protein